VPAAAPSKILVPPLVTANDPEAPLAVLAWPMVSMINTLLELDAKVIDEFNPVICSKVFAAEVLNSPV
jgi:hypothetical protein